MARERLRAAVGLGAGGGTDNLARIIEPLVSKGLGQPLVIAEMTLAPAMLTALYSPRSMALVELTISAVASGHLDAKGPADAFGFAA